eukprot:CAMPEP_0194215052 /NCGR_PEP_ID=MMETSP0156-20130528/16557_1 /TAXON_ID=33649 /ORGANISM="Thalassionema nitzschioides, Strain L26-B" /LENGTH=370 /DNA_ID=CAMNT_0038943471 /DNA_START=72 /DNA_END=1184 /DNA_ORIENTATION=+
MTIKVVSIITALSLFVLMFHENNAPRIRRQLMIDPRTVDTKIDTSLLNYPGSDIDNATTTTEYRVIVLTVWTHYPELLESHIASISTFLTPKNMEYICILNSHNPQTNQELMDIAERLNVTHLTVPQPESSRHDPSRHHANALEQALHQFLLNPQSPIQIQPDDILLLFDSDMFLLQPTSVEEILHHGQYSIATMLQRRGTLLSNTLVEYLWPNLAILQFSNPTMYNELGFFPMRLQVGNQTFNLDSGGASHSVVARTKQANRTRGMRQVDCSTQNDGHNNNDPSSILLLLKSQNWLWYEAQRNHPAIPENCVKPDLLGYNNDCKNIIYHLGSAGSNWRNCPEDYLQQQRTQLQQHLRQQMQQYNNNNRV